MGGAVSAGLDNDDLIDNLVRAKYIKKRDVERVFRVVDRAFYFIPPYDRTAYKDVAWKHGNIHISAPCIYSEVMENLELKPGLSFLNVGSGTGYLSTMAGLILGPHGINHGIELYQDVIDYAYKKLELFMSTCNAIDEFDLCQPVFIQGNGFCLTNLRQYDRVYCGAACPENRRSYMKNLLKIGGILVMPCNDDLLKITRRSETSFNTELVLPVSFANLQLPDKKANRKKVPLPSLQPLPLQEICRFYIRKSLRLVVEKDNPHLVQPSKIKRRLQRRRDFRHLFMLNRSRLQEPNSRVDGTLFFDNYEEEMPNLGDSSENDTINREGISTLMSIRRELARTYNTALPLPVSFPFPLVVANSSVTFLEEENNQDEMVNDNLFSDGNSNSSGSSTSANLDTLDEIQHRFDREDVTDPAFADIGIDTVLEEFTQGIRNCYDNGSDRRTRSKFVRSKIQKANSVLASKEKSKEDEDSRKGTVSHNPFLDFSMRRINRESGKHENQGESSHNVQRQVEDGSNVNSENKGVKNNAGGEDKSGDCNVVKTDYIHRATVKLSRKIKAPGSPCWNQRLNRNMQLKSDDTAKASDTDSIGTSTSTSSTSSVDGEKYNKAPGSLCWKQQQLVGKVESKLTDLPKASSNIDVSDSSSDEEKCNKVQGQGSLCWGQRLSRNMLVKSNESSKTSDTDVISTSSEDVQKYNKSAENLCWGQRLKHNMLLKSDNLPKASDTDMISTNTNEVEKCNNAARSLCWGQLLNPNVRLKSNNLPKDSDTDAIGSNSDDGEKCNEGLISLDWKPKVDNVESIFEHLPKVSNTDIPGDEEKCNESLEDLCRRRELILKMAMKSNDSLTDIDSFLAKSSSNERGIYNGTEEKECKREMETVNDKPFKNLPSCSKTPAPLTCVPLFKINNKRTEGDKNSSDDIYNGIGKQRAEFEKEHFGEKRFKNSPFSSKVSLTRIPLLKINNKRAEGDSDSSDSSNSFSDAQPHKIFKFEKQGDDLNLGLNHRRVKSESDLTTESVMDSDEDFIDEIINPGSCLTSPFSPSSSSMSQDDAFGSCIFEGDEESQNSSSINKELLLGDAEPEEYKPGYHTLMREKIKALPIPWGLKNYLNYYRHL